MSGGGPAAGGKGGKGGALFNGAMHGDYQPPPAPPSAADIERKMHKFAVEQVTAGQDTAIGADYSGMIAVAVI